VDVLVNTMPFDIIVIASHAGDMDGERVTYVYDDFEGKSRKLVVDEATGFGVAGVADQVSVTTYSFFVELDGVAWDDPVARETLEVESAILAWTKLSEDQLRRTHRVDAKPLARVRGSMAIKMSDGVWMAPIHGMSPEAAPVVFNNSCSSWHELSKRFTFAGARSYVGTLFPVTDFEAQDVAQRVFVDGLGSNIAVAVWNAQQKVYGSGPRRPYVVVGLPFCEMRANPVPALEFLNDAYLGAIKAYRAKATRAPEADVRRNSQSYLDVLEGEFAGFRKRFIRSR
jgi:hypothetical protein